ncbi:MAG: hypothetical protein ACRDUB_21455, partial [Mycobacterium sp.]
RPGLAGGVEVCWRRHVSGRQFMSLCGAERQANFAAGRVERTEVRAGQSLGAAACRAGSSRAGRVGAPVLGRRRLRLWRSVAERA